MLEIEQLIPLLNDTNIDARLDALRKIFDLINSGQTSPAVDSGSVNNHIHTKYSFSPYYPTMAVYMAYSAGLATAGIMDHDSVGGAKEFIEAGKIANLAVTNGLECRVSMKNTRLGNKGRINNPDQDGIIYVAMHGIPHMKIDEAEAFLAPYRAARNVRNRAMTERLAEMMHPFGIDFNFDRDVSPISLDAEKGSITERHILFALSIKVEERFGRGKAVVDFLKNDLNINLSEKIEAFLLDTENKIYTYDLLGVMKADLVEKFYIDAIDECPDVAEFIAFTKKIGAISAYAYLGDVGNSVTGDKRVQKFEDDYIDELFLTLKECGFNAVTYMPTRNTLEQLLRVQNLCRQHGFFEISGEDINSPRQSFICEALKRPEFAHLMESTWALIGHEQAASVNINNGMFSEKTVAEYCDLSDRVKYFSAKN